jgi:teichoic acid transport system permease protein
MRPAHAVSCDVVTDVADKPTRLAGADVDTLVARYGLKRAGARLPLGQYSRELWARRHFIVEYSRARNAAGFSRSLLGQAWQVLTPLLNAAVYYLIFGLLLDTKRGVDNFIAFLVIGIFTFRFIQSSTQSGSTAIVGNLGLTRTLHFPRAVLPISATLVALQQLLFSMIVMLAIVLGSGEPLRLEWLLMIPAIALATLFCGGLAMIVARIGSKIPDLAQVLPFLMRTWMYMSGVMYSIQYFTARFHNELLTHALKVNPAAVYIELMRVALLPSHTPLSPHIWWYAIGWGVVFAVGGYIYFWLGEEEYGRV